MRNIGRMSDWMRVIALCAFSISPLQAAGNLKINPHLNYSSDSQDGPLITGDHMQEGPERGKPNYVFMYSEG